MEVFAVFGGRLSLFNRELKQDPRYPGDYDYVTLSVVFDHKEESVDVNTGKYVLFEARFDGIIGILPYRTITIIEEGGLEYTTVLYRVILDDLKNGVVVFKEKDGNKSVYNGNDPIGVESLRDYESVEEVVNQLSRDIKEINCSLSRFDCPPTGI